MKPLDRLLSVLTYLSYGFFGLIWLIVCHFAKKQISSDLTFNIYQSIFISVLLTVISMLYSFFIQLVAVVSKTVAINIDMYLNHYGILSGFSISAIFVIMLMTYMVVLCLLGKKPYISGISDIIASNFGV